MSFVHDIMVLNSALCRMGRLEAADIEVERDVFMQLLFELFEQQQPVLEPYLIIRVEMPVVGNSYFLTKEIESRPNTVRIDARTVLQGIKIPVPQGFSTLRMKLKDRNEVIDQIRSYGIHE